MSMLKNLRIIYAFYSLIGLPRLLPILIGGLLENVPAILGVVSPLLVRKLIDGLAKGSMVSPLTLPVGMGVVFSCLTWRSSGIMSGVCRE